MTLTIQPMLSVFDRVIPIGVRADRIQLHGARNLALLAAVTALSVPLLTVMYHLLGYDLVGMMVLTAGVVMMVSPFTLVAGLGLPVARDIFIGALFLLKVWMAVNLGGVGAPTTSWFVLCPAVAMVVGGLRPGVIWATIVLVTVIAVFIFGQLGFIRAGSASSGMAILHLASFVGLLALVTLIIVMALDTASERRTSISSTYDI
jgi:hypothetical protein